MRNCTSGCAIWREPVIGPATGWTRWVAPETVSLLRLQVGFGWGRVYGPRDCCGARRQRWFGLGVACDRRRPGPIDAFWPDSVNRKSVTGSPQRQRALSAQTFPVDDSRWTCRRRLPRGHNQRRALAIVAQRVGPQRQRDEGTTGHLAPRNPHRRMRR